MARVLGIKEALKQIVTNVKWDMCVRNFQYM
jgi:hypothetical protein